MDTAFAFRLVIGLAFLSTSLMYLGTFYLSRITKEFFLNPSPATLFKHFFVYKITDIDSTHHESFQKFKRSIFFAQLVNFVAFIVFSCFLIKN